MRTKAQLLFLFLILSSSVFSQLDSTAVAWKVKELILFQEGDQAFDKILPKESKLDNLRFMGEDIVINLDVPLDFLTKEYGDMEHEELIESVAPHLSEFGFYNVQIRAKNKQGKYEPLSMFFAEQLPPLDIPQSYNTTGLPGEFARRSVIALDNQAQPFGQLTGKTVWLSPGHGWHFNRRIKDFITQRHNSFGLVEDFGTSEAINYYLLKYLYNSGGNIWSVRERDMNEHEVIVDNDDGSPTYTEVGTWTTSKSKGYNNSTYKYSWSVAKETAVAVYTPDIPESGWYWVSVRYLASGNRSEDVRFKVQHAGGESTVSINQKTHGLTWVYLGQFYFEKGTTGKVMLSNKSSQVGGAIIADAVRFGGGKATMIDCDFGKKGNEPRHEMAARYYAQFQGYPECKNDVGIRPAYAEWELAKGTAEEKANAVYISWHTNAANGIASGTETFSHSYRSTWKSRALRNFIHDQLVSDLQKGWDKDWRDRGKKSADYGELRGLLTMPGALIEIGFHDNEEDAKALTTPAFRQIAARAVYKGIVRYFASRDGKSPVFLPEPPTHILAKNDGEGNVSVSWNAPKFGGVLGDAANAYKVYISEHGKAFPGGGFKVNETSYTFTDLEPEKTYYIKVAATNGGGESFPSSVVAVRTPKKGASIPFLIVDGFDRLDRWSAVKEQEAVPKHAPLGETRRLFIDRMNNYDYSVDHARSIEKLGVAFDGATNEAIIDKKVTLTDYGTIDWILGEESSADHTLDAKEQSLLKAFLKKGGNLIISGAELAYHLDYKRAGRDFYRNYLKAKYAGDNAKTSKFEGRSSTDFKGIKDHFNKQGQGYYLVDYPDVLSPSGGSKTIVKYSNGKTAAIGYKKKFGIVNFGFPLEMVNRQETLDKIFAQAAKFLDAIPKEEPQEEPVED